MAKVIDLSDDDKIDNLDWKAKSNKIIDDLEESLFKHIFKEDSYDVKYDKNGNEIKTKKRVKKGDVMPDISPAQVSIKLNRLLRVYRPMDLNKAMEIEDYEYLNAYGYYLDIISYINQYTTFVGDKQTFSAFCNITTDIYNELLTRPKYAQVFSSIEDGFVQSNFAVAQAGLIDSKVAITKLQTKDAGHNLVKNPDTLVFNYSPKIDKQQVNLMLDKFSSMTDKKLINNKK